MSKKITVIDYGLGNIFSIRQALIACGADVKVSKSIKDIELSDGIILPGVGAFAEAMKRLTESGLDKILVSRVKSGKPLLGVCLGLQLLFSKSSEFGETKGLDLIQGEVVRFPSSYMGKHLSVPFVGWNGLKKMQVGNHLLTSLLADEKFYYVHSYHAKPIDKACVVASCDYLGYEYPAIIQFNNVVGIQGHPEKSGEQGLTFYRNWLNNI